ncbi:MAG: UbiH/UbiF/VisC/COQ6 family ubiquinone biosynthesis hydroxylase [Rhodospirillaceae bacterium]|nr:UbiH/UbiF/VisC/COQ6 family ubiquinone biosynthesis hydroxylase [Rhodospirillaceae bacterium]
MQTSVLIVGAGLAGASLAAALGSVGVATVLIDRDPPDQRLDPKADGRTTAVSLASRRVLEAAGVWQGVADRASPIWSIQISDHASPAAMDYDHRDVGEEPFGHIVDNQLLRRAQLDRLAELPSVTVLAPAALDTLERTSATATARLADGTEIRAELVVGADGRGSTVRRSAGIEVMSWRYNQTAIACCMSHELPHNGMALEHFMPGGPFAVLPMIDREDGSHRSSIVWTERPDRAKAMAALDEAAFSRELQWRVGDHLGRVALSGGRWTYPLGVLHAKRYTDTRLALISEAAHAIHPIAGQGLNMGFRDIATLAELVVDRARLGLDAGAPDLLRAYERWRLFDNVSLVAITDGLNRLFSNRSLALRGVRGAGLSVVGRISPLKKVFMRHAMGLMGDLPRTLRGRPL